VPPSISIFRQLVIIKPARAATRTIDFFILYLFML